MFYYTGLKIEFFDLENIKNSEKVFIDNGINKNGLKEIEKQTKIILDFEYANKRFIKNLNGVYILEKVLNKKSNMAVFALYKRD